MPLFDFECRLAASQPATEAETGTSERGLSTGAQAVEPTALPPPLASVPQQGNLRQRGGKGRAELRSPNQGRCSGHFRWPLDPQVLQRLTPAASDSRPAEPRPAQGLSAQQEPAVSAGLAGQDREGAPAPQDWQAVPDPGSPLAAILGSAAAEGSNPGLEHTLLAAFAALVYRYDPTRSEATLAVFGTRQGPLLESGLPSSTSSDEHSESTSQSDKASDSWIPSRSSSTSSSSSGSGGSSTGAALRPVVFRFECEVGPGEAPRAVAFGDVLRQSFQQWPRPVHVSTPSTELPALASCSTEGCAADAAFLVVHPSDVSAGQALDEGVPGAPCSPSVLHSHPCCASSAHEPLLWAGEAVGLGERDVPSPAPSLVLRMILPQASPEAWAATACPAPVEALLSYDEAVFDAAFVERMGAHYSALLASLSSLPSSPAAPQAAWTDNGTGALRVSGKASWEAAGLPGVKGDAVASREAAPLASLRMLSPGEVLRVQTELSGSLFWRALGPPDDNLTDMVERQAAEQPGATAVADDAISLTYAQLRSQARRVAYHLLVHPGLRNSGRAPGSPEAVGLAMERGVEWVVSLLGVLYAGMAYVPLDPALPAARLRHIVESAELQTVLTTASCQEQFLWVQGVRTGARGLPVRLLPVSEALGHACGTPKVPSRQEGEEVGRVLGAAKAKGCDPCYILFTSGSTGQPKGVVVLHQGVLNMCHAFRGVLVGSAPDVRAQMAAMTFDLHAMELFLAFDTGATVAVCTKEELLSDLGGFIRRRGVRGLVLTPTVGSLLDPRDLPSLQWLAFGGEILPRALARRWTQAGCTVVDHYGPTEVSIAATGQIWRPGSEVEDHIGHPLRGAHVYVVGPQQELLPVGVPGEICIAGVHVSQGYLKRPDLTSRAYLPNPFSVGPHDRVLYRTGDRGRWLPSGNLQFLGRVDFQIKLRGLRVEPGEIENHISRVRGVARCVVVLRHSDAGAAFLAAYIMPSVELPRASSALTEGVALDDGEGLSLVQRVRRALEEQVPDYMVPSAFVLLDKLPQTSSGKVDRKLLPKPTAGDFGASPVRGMAGSKKGALGEGQGGGGEGGAMWEGESGRQEGVGNMAGARAGEKASEGDGDGDGEGEGDEECKRMCALFAEILGLDRSLVHPGSNFFHLGGNSLTAAHLVSRIHQLHSGVPRARLSIRAFFQSPTPAATAAAVALADHPEGGYTVGKGQGEGSGGKAGPGVGAGAAPRALHADEQQRQLVHEFVMHKRQQKALLYQHSLGQAYAKKQQRQQQAQGQTHAQPLLSLLPTSLFQALRLGPTVKPSLGPGPGRPGRDQAGGARGSRAVYPSEALLVPEAALSTGGAPGGAPLGSAAGLPSRSGSGAPPKIRCPQIMPLSHAQEMIWLVQHVIPQPQMLYPCDVWRVQGALDVARVEKAFEILIRRHQALRLSHNSDASPSARLMSAMLEWWGPGGGQGAGGESLSTFIPPTASARVHPDAGAKAGAQIPGIKGAATGSGTGTGTGAPSLSSSSSPLSSADSSPESTPRAYQGGQAAPRPAAGGMAGAVLPALTSSVMGLVAPAFVKNLHSIFRCVNQQDLDPARRPFRVEEEDLRGVADDQERTFLVAMALRRACRPLTGKGSAAAPPATEGAAVSLEGRARAGVGTGEEERVGGYLFRVTVVRTGENQSLLVCIFNHLIFDGISSAVLYREFPHVYATLSTEGLPETSSYAEYVAWEDAHLEAGARERELGFWRECLGRDPPSLQLVPSPGPGGLGARRPGAQTGALPCRGGWVDFTVAAPLRYALEALASRQGATLNMAMLAAYHSMLHAWTGQREVITGMLVARRFLPAHQHMLGHCADLAPVLTAHSRASSGSGSHAKSSAGVGEQAGRGTVGASWAGGGSWAASRAMDQGSAGAGEEQGERGGESVAPSFLELLGQVRERVLQVLENQAVTFRMIAAEVLSHPDLAKSALVQAYFNFLQPGVNCSPEEVSLSSARRGEREGPASCRGEDGGEEPVKLTYDNDLSWVNEGRAALTPLSLTLRVRSDGSMRGRMVYQADILEAHLAEAMAFNYKMILERALEEEGLRLQSPRNGEESTRS